MKRFAFLRAFGIGILVLPGAMQTALAGDPRTAGECVTQLSDAWTLMTTNSHAADVAYEKWLGVSPAASLRMEASFVLLEAASEQSRKRYEDLESFCEGLHDVSARSSSKDPRVVDRGSPSPSGNRFVDAVKGGDAPRSNAGNCRMSSLRLCHDVCDGEYGSVCMYGQICDPDKHVCEKAGP